LLTPDDPDCSGDRFLFYSNHTQFTAAQANEQFMQQLAAARAAADALESEKKELFNELTKIKQDAVVKVSAHA
jgi:hypothetical protein